MHRFFNLYPITRTVFVCVMENNGVSGCNVGPLKIKTGQPMTARPTGLTKSQWEYKDNILFLTLFVFLYGNKGVWLWCAKSCCFHSLLKSKGVDFTGDAGKTLFFDKRWASTPLSISFQPTKSASLPEHGMGSDWTRTTADLKSLHTPLK